MRQTFLLAILGLFMLTTATAQTFQSGDLTFAVVDDAQGECSVTAAAVRAQIVVPRTVDYGGTTYTVTRIGKRVFNANTVLTAVYLPSTLKLIDYYAFEGCTALRTLTLPDALTTIENAAFEGCASLPALVLPASLTYIGTSAFADCTSLTALDVPAAVRTIRGNPVDGCTALTSLTVDNANTHYESRGANAIIETEHNTLIAGCAATRIPATVEAIGQDAFHGCTTLTAIDIPTSVTMIDDAAFNGCTALTSIYLPSSVTRLGESVFAGCEALRTVRLPAYITEIADNLFWNCTALLRLDLPPCVQKIGTGVFFACNHLQQITLPASLQTIQPNAFKNNYDLTEVYAHCDYAGKTELQTLAGAHFYVPFDYLAAYEAAFRDTPFTPIEPVELTFRGPLATLMLPTDAALPAGMKAYKVFYDKRLWTNESASLQAYRPYLVAAQEGDYHYFHGLTARDNVPHTFGALTGVQAFTPLDDAAFTLQGTAFTREPAPGYDFAFVQPWQCYLTADTLATTLPLTALLDAIPALRRQDVDEVHTYDLIGRPVAHPRRGIYIRNGRKINVAR